MSLFRHSRHVQNNSQDADLERLAEDVSPGAYQSQGLFRCESARPSQRELARSIIAVAHLADIMLSVELKPEPADEIKLGSEQVDVVFAQNHTPIASQNDFFSSLLDRFRPIENAPHARSQ